MIVLFFLFAIFGVSPAFAQVTFEGPVTAALGGSGRAGLDANDGIYLNPALVAMMPKSEAGGYYQDGTRAAGEHHNAWGFDLSQNDKDAYFSGHLGYIHSRTTGLIDTPVNGDLWRLAIGKMFFDDHLALGLAVYHYGASADTMDGNEQWNGSVGGVFLILPKLGVAYVYDNPAHPSSSVPLPVQFLPQQSVGVFWGTPWYVRLRLDLVYLEQNNPNQRVDTRGSLESEFADYFLFRLGGRFDEAENQRFITAGLSFNGPVIKIDYAIEKNVSGVGGAVHSVDLRATF